VGPTDIASLHEGWRVRTLLSTAGTQIFGKAKHRTGGNISFTLDMTITIVFSVV